MHRQMVSFTRPFEVPNRLFVEHVARFGARLDQLFAGLSSEGNGIGLS